MAHFASGTKTESCTLSLTGSSIPSKRAASMSDSSRRRMAVWVSESKRADLKLVGKRTCSTLDRKSTRLNSSHLVISYAVFCLKKKTVTAICRTQSYETSEVG